MKQSIIIAFIAIGAFLLGTLMPRSPSDEPGTIIQYRDTSYSRLDIGTITKLDIPEISGVPSVLYIPETEIQIEYRDCTRYVVLPREHKLLDNEDVKVWYSGVDPSIDSLIVKKKTIIQKEPWKRHSISLVGKAGFSLLGAGAEYEYKIFKWLSVQADVGYDFYKQQPYALAGAKVRLYSW